MGAHINSAGEFQSDKYPTCPAGKVPLSTKDPMAQDLIAIYAQRRRPIDGAFSDDLETALESKGFDVQDFTKREAARQKILSIVLQNVGSNYRKDRIAFDAFDSDTLEAVRVALGRP